MSLLSVRGLNVTFVSGEETIHAVNSLDLDLDSGGSLALVGESGSGKSVLASAILGTLEENGMASGQVWFNGRNILGLDEAQMMGLRGREICLVPQNAWSAWDPVMRIGDQMTEFMRCCGVPREEAPDLALEYAQMCGLGPEVLRSYAHRLSGGMSQRAMIAMCASVRPRLLIADEPTKGLDGRSRGMVLDLLNTVVDEAALLMITHDLRAARSCREVAVLYGGRIVESGPANEVLDIPLHPYTAGLCAAHPRRGMVPIPGGEGHRSGVLGCCFQERCRLADEACRSEVAMSGGARKVRCCHADR